MSKLSSGSRMDTILIILSINKPFGFTRFCPKENAGNEDSCLHSCLEMTRIRECSMPKRDLGISDKKSPLHKLTQRHEDDIDHGRQQILVCDEKQFRRDLVSQVIVCCGAKPDCHTRFDELVIQGSLNQQSLIAVVALGGVPLSLSPVMDTIRHLKSSG